MSIVNLINMSIVNPRSLFVLLFLSFICLSANCQPLHLQATGDSLNGFHVDIFDGDHLLVKNIEEFSIQLFNTDYSTTANIESWKGDDWTGNDTLIILTRDSYIPEFNASLSVCVRYHIINQNVVKKTIQLFQPSMTDMYYILKETIRPAEKPLNTQHLNTIVSPVVLFTRCTLPQVG